jgi:hypothetical protein
VARGDDGLSGAEISELAQAFPSADSARPVLSEAGLPPSRQPGWRATAHQFWSEVSVLLAAGAAADGPRRLLRLAADRFPGNPVFRRALGHRGEATAAGGAAAAAGPPPGTAWPPVPAGATRAGAWLTSRLGHAAATGPAPATLLAADVVSFTHLGTLVRIEMRDWLRTVVRGAVITAGAGEDATFHDRGEGVLLTVPSPVPEARLIALLVTALRDAVATHNRERSGPGIRLRLAAHHVDPSAEPGTPGEATAAAVVVTRLLDLPALRFALAQDDGAEVGLVVSGEVYQAGRDGGLADLAGGRATEIDVSLPGFSGQAWVLLPGRRGAPETTGPRHRQEPAPGPRPQEAPPAAYGTAAYPAPPGQAAAEVPVRSVRDLAVDWGEPGAGPGRAPTPADDGTRQWDLVVSYTAADEAWGLWIAWQLETSGFAAHQEAWDLLPGANAATLLAETVRSSVRTVVVLTRGYLHAARVQAQWQAAWQADPDALRHAVIPVRVEPVRPEGLLRDLRYIDLVGLRHEDAARTLVREVRASLVGERSTNPPRPRGNG